ncbi:hypothetical protein ACFQS7_20565 [Dankookia sp. GCM10030260]|uniref:hypothetical protein n=1 Tax=Dankookia sp. GCM10030260 TaxID=3273390 RepID=UPI00360EC46E
MPWPEPSPGQLSYTEYGDTDGALGGRTVAAGQTLPVGFGDFLQQNQTGPASVHLRVFGDADVLQGRAAGGDDLIGGNGGTTLLFGDARLMQGGSRGGDDILRAGGNFNFVFGDAGSMTGASRGGDDDILGSNGLGSRIGAANDLFGDAYDLSGHARGGDDRVAGGGAFPGTVNRLYGDGHSLSGHAAGGDDLLLGGRNAINDFWGDAAVIKGPAVTTGADTFVIRPDSLANTIHDFEPGKDLIDLRAYAAAGIHGFADLAPLIQVTEAGSVVVFGSAAPAGNTLSVLGDTALGAGDFLFA